MIEVLVAIVVLSIGLLGLASLQATGLKQNHSALMRSQATVLAYDIIDRMRANRDSALNNNYNIALNTATPNGATIPEVDIKAWRDKLTDLLPNGNGSVTRDADQFTITVQWNDKRAEGTDGDSIKSVSVDTQI